jgi:hypothetical protein
MHTSNLEFSPVHAEALVTVAFDGLGLFCVTDDNKCEIGIMRSPADHELGMLIRRTAPTEHVFAELPSLEHNIKIEVSHPTQPGIEPYRNYNYQVNGQAEAFDRTLDKGDPKDFRWMIDLENPPFHNGAITFGADPSSQQPKVLKPVITVPTGTMYTLEKVGPDQATSRVRFDDGAPPNDQVFVGKVGHALGIDMLCQAIDESKLIISNVDANGQAIPGMPRIELPGGAGVRYEIAIRNLCTDCPPDPQIGIPATGTDFRFYYDVVHHQGGERFDLRRAVSMDLLPADAQPVPEVPGLGLDGDPQACHITGLSRTTAIPRG